MNTYTKTLSRLLLLFCCLTPFSLWAQGALLANGIIDKIGTDKIIITDSDFKLLATTKVILPHNKKGQIKDLKTGDFVSLSLIKIDHIEYVDTITVLPEP